MKHDCDAFYIKRPDEMQGYFSRYPQAFANACEIAARCNVELNLGKPELPDFKLPPGSRMICPATCGGSRARGLRCG